VPGGDYLMMFLLALLGILCPVFNTEVSFLAMTYRDNHLLVLSGAAAVGSSAGFMVFYYLGFSSRRLSRKLEEKVRSIDLNRFGRSSVLILATSYVLSVPPCTPLSIAAGALRYSLKKLIPCLFLFRFLKYVLLAYFFDSIHGAVRVFSHSVQGYKDALLAALRAIF